MYHLDSDQISSVGYIFLEPIGIYVPNNFFLQSLILIICYFIITMYFSNLYFIHNSSSFKLKKGSEIVANYLLCHFILSTSVKLK